MNRLKFQLDIVKVLSQSLHLLTKVFLTDDEDNRVVIAFTKRSKRYNPPAIHVMAFILAIKGVKTVKKGSGSTGLDASVSPRALRISGYFHARSHTVLTGAKVKKPGYQMIGRFVV
ncbi:hypothetical protein TNCV_3367891 [Trichonephila clavipes]|nr:hypothetical protein TNCV_3367891 [Trichonephila clavipes]